MNYKLEVVILKNFFIDYRKICYYNSLKKYCKFKFMNIINISTKTLLETRNKVLDSPDKEQAFVLQGNVKGTRNKVYKIHNLKTIRGSSNNTSSIDNTHQSLNFERNIANHVGVGHSHLSKYHHPDYLSDFDKSEIARRKLETQEKVYMLFYVNSEGNVEYKGFNDNSERINVKVTNHKGESRISGENTGGEKCWGDDFWGTDPMQNSEAANDSIYQKAA